MVAQNLKIDLEEERSANQASLATIQALQGRLAFSESETYRVEIAEKYRDSPLDKVEVALACKAGFDCLLELLPRESRPAQDHIYYPSRVANCLDILKEIEVKGGGIVLDEDDGDEGDEESREDSMRVDREEATTTIAQPTPAPESSAALPSPTPDPGRSP